MRFQPGQSGNPNGRPKIPNEVKEALKALTMPAVQKLAELLRSDDDRVAMTAVKEVLDRNLGKPVQPVEIDPAQLPDRELKQAMAEVVDQWKQEGALQ